MTGLLAREYAEVTPLFVKAGLRWEDAELAALERFFSGLDAPAVRPIVELRLDISTIYGSHWSVGGTEVPDAQQPDEAWYLPGRNLLLAGGGGAVRRGARDAESGHRAAGQQPFSRCDAGLSAQPGADGGAWRWIPASRC